MRKTISTITDGAIIELTAKFVEQDGELSDKDIKELVSLSTACISIIEMGESRNEFLEMKEAFESCIR